MMIRHMTKTFKIAAVIVAILTFSGLTIIPLRAQNSESYKKALEFYRGGMYERAMASFETIAKEEKDNKMAEGYAALCAVRLQVEGCENIMETYLISHPCSILETPLHFYQGLNYFDREDYTLCSKEFSLISATQLESSKRPEYIFKQAYCNFMEGRIKAAELGFQQMLAFPHNDYTAPSQYGLGYISYSQKEFARAADLFTLSEKDPRFTDISKYYILECRFMQKDYKYVVKEGDKIYKKATADRKTHISRIISESYLVLGDATKAREYYDKDLRTNSEHMNRSDYFYAGSVLYAVRDYKGAVENFSMMPNRTDSLGQIANYDMGYSYIQLKNKVAAMTAFEDAANVNYDADIKEDAFFNYAKLAFDLNHDAGAFRRYINEYSDRHKGNLIYNYMALASLYSHDYASAVKAFDKIDELDDKMKANYMKANYLRASQLISGGSFRDAIPCLKAAAYYSDNKDNFNQLSRYWLAESYYRCDDFAQARDIYKNLYNISALDRMNEGKALPYDIAYTYFKEGNYADASKWFERYLSENYLEYKKDAGLRLADCDFIRKNYKKAIPSYEKVISEYRDINDIYPYFQLATAYDLTGNISQKINVLEKVKNANVNSLFYSDAMFELGRAYVSANRDNDAIKCFEHLEKVSRDSSIIAKSLIQLGMIARNSSEFEKALGYYRTVIEDMPGTGHKEDALLAMEAIYQSQGEPDKYFAYLETIGGAKEKTEGEKENMYFNAAEQVFLAENYPKALTALLNFEKKFPESAMMSKADFYMAECYKNMGKKEQACDSYRKVAEEGDVNSFTELAILNFSKLSYEMQHFDDAYRGYSSLLANARIDNNKYIAEKGMMKSAFYGHKYDDAINAAEVLISDNRSNRDDKRVAEYIMAKSYLATSRRERAFELFDKLSASPATWEGAEASYLVIQDTYDKGLFDEVETKVYKFADEAPDRLYWLAKSFIVLGDSFVERDRLKQAKATFDSIANSYVPQRGESDDVLDNVRMRQAKLAELMDNVE